MAPMDAPIVDQAYFDAFLIPGRERLLRARPDWDKLRDERGRHALMAGAFHNPDVLREAARARQKSEAERTKALARSVDEAGRGLWHAAMSRGQDLMPEHWAFVGAHRLRRDVAGRGVIPSLLDWGKTELSVREPELWLPNADDMGDVFGADFDAGQILACPDRAEAIRTAGFMLDGHDIPMRGTGSGEWSADSGLILSLQCVAMKADPATLADLPGPIRGSLAILLCLSHPRFDDMSALLCDEEQWEARRLARLAPLMGPGCEIHAGAADLELLARTGVPPARSCVLALIEAQELGSQVPEAEPKAGRGPRI